MPNTLPERPVFNSRLILFDLDGTFADTAPDLAAALNRLLAEEDRPPLPYNAIRPVASMGGAALVNLGFGLEESDPGFHRLRERFLGLYLDNIAGHTRLFPEMEQVLERIETTQAGWGIVTNKPGWLTEPLMLALNLRQRARCIVSGDTIGQRKPHPGPLLHACALAGVRPQECVYVGDARRDVEAARQAGMPVIVAAYGYIPAGEDPASWDANGIIHNPLGLLTWLNLDTGKPGS